MLNLPLSLSLSLIQVTYILLTSSISHTGIINSGATDHMTENRCIMSSFIPAFSVLNIGYQRYTGWQNYIQDTGYRVIYRDMVLNTG